MLDLNVYYEVLGNNPGKTLKDILDGDSSVLSGGEMKYFDKKYFGMVPNYGVLMRLLNNMEESVRDKFLRDIKEIELNGTLSKMGKLAEGYGETGAVEDRVQFNMYSKMAHFQDRSVDRLNKNVTKDGMGGMGDKLDKLISLLSNDQLERVKEVVLSVEDKTVDVKTEEVK